MMTTSSPELPRCDTELSLRLGRLAPAPSRCRATGEQKQAAGSDGGLTGTELQAMAILRVARRAAAEEAEEGVSGDGTAGRLSMRRSMEWFLQRRREREREERRQRGADADSAAAAASPSSSSSFSCLTDSSPI